MLLVALPAHATGTGKVIINEFLALNSSGLQDEDGDYSDWIELYNPGTTAINLKGWSLTDDASELNKWVFPEVTLAAGKYMLLFASGKDIKAPTGSNKMHTNFKLSGGGEYLAIVEPNKVVSHEYAPRFPSQESNVSYGVYLGQYTYFSTPTPGGQNIFTGVLSPIFSVERGFFDNAFSVALTVGDASTKIYYTIDGTIPGVNSMLYTGPISISTTTPLSAVGIKGSAKSATITNTYFFIKDIVKQPNSITDYPTSWGYLNYGIGGYPASTRTPADYAMDPTVCNHPDYKNLIKDAFLAIPSISVVTNAGYIFSHSTDPDTGGIYIYTGDSGNPSASGGNKLGDGWERPASIEFYEPNTGKQFQVNCGLRLHGGNSRKPYNTSKHSFRVHFKKKYGPGNLYYNVFEDETAAEKFGHLVFRAGYNYSWLKNNVFERAQTQYIYDSFAKKTQLAMGHHATHDRFAHLFINGIYWGMYNISERVRNQFTAVYMGGNEDDYDVVDDDYAADGAAEGDLIAFNQMHDLAKAGNYDELLLQSLLNMENFIDYMLLNFYIGNKDWGKNNWYAARNKVNPGKGFQFFSWDAENSLNDINVNTITTFEGPLRTMMFGSADHSVVNGGLCGNEDFKMLLADRIQKNFFGDGALTVDKVIERYEKLADEIDLPIILESARWGDFRKNTVYSDDTRILYTRNEHWLPVKNDLLSNYFLARTDTVFNQLKRLELFPSVDAPIFSAVGGVVLDTFNLSIAAASGDIYFTIDGTDPRKSGTGAVSETASLYRDSLCIVGKGTVLARARVADVWSALASVVFYDKPIIEDSIDYNTSVSIAMKDLTMFRIESENLYYNLPMAGKVTIELFTIGGNKVKHINIRYQAEGVHQVNIGGLPLGIYICRLRCDKNIITRKIIKLR